LLRKKPANEKRSLPHRKLKESVTIVPSLPWLVPDDGTPLQIYHGAWNSVSKRSFKVPTDWGKWQHRFDREIHTVEDSVRCTRLMIASLNDRFTRFISADEVREKRCADFSDTAGIGIIASVKLDASGALELDADGNSILETDNQGFPLIKVVRSTLPAALMGVKVGDAIVSVDGIDAIGKSEDQLGQLFAGAVNSEVVLCLSRGGEVINLKITRKYLTIPPVESKLLPGNIGYIKLEDFLALGAVRKTMEALASFKSADALVVDLRGNPGGTTTNAVEMAAAFLPAGEIVRTTSRVPGSPLFKKFETAVYRLTQDRVICEANTAKLFGRSSLRMEEQLRVPYHAKGRPVVILVNGDTASAAEMFTGAVRDNGYATVIGTRTFGKGIGQVEERLVLGTKLVVTMGRYYTPSGAWLGDGGNTVSNGIVPDLIVPLNAPFCQLGSKEDSQLCAAVDFLSEKLAK
jgi:carboxyl-terminal processing protease